MKTPGIVRLVTIVFLAAAAAAAQSGTVNVQVSNQVNTSSGENGRLQLAMSTSFQLAGWSYTFFGGAPGAAANLTALNPFHTRVQVISDGIPLTGPDTWNFTELNTMLSPIQATGDHSPEFQIGTAPAFLSNSSGQILAAGIPAFAQMSGNLVRYYNTGGFTDAGIHYQSPTRYPVTFWGIFNEPDINGVSASEYVTLYNTVVPAMAQADPNIKFVAVELALDPSGNGNYFPTFVNGVTAPVDVVAKHFYSTCNQKDLDRTLFATVPGFASQVREMYQDMTVNAALANVPVWITENNVNADYDQGNGISACNAPQKFVLDTRGSSPFFAAWRSLVFQQLGEAGAQALYHWSFGTDAQFGEVDATGNLQFSYWVDYYLSHWLPSPPGQDILQTTTSGCCLTASLGTWQGGSGLPYDTQTMAARNADGSVVILMSNYALSAAGDNNGPGLSRTFALDLSALGTFSNATLVTLDTSTPATGPVPQSLTPAPEMQVTLPGYGAALLRLSNAQPALPAGGVVNAASYTAGAVAPGEIVSLFGSGLGPAQGANLEFTYPTLVSNSLAGVHVLFDGVPATIAYASTGQVNAVVPYGVAGHSATQLEVEYLGAVSAPLTIPVTAVSPALFTSESSGTGQGAILNLTGLPVNSAANPAARGAWVAIFGTGMGVTAPASTDGLLSTPPYGQLPAGVNVTVTMGGIPCQTNYVGAAPGLVSGALQINAQVPAGVTPAPDVPVVVTIGGVSSQNGVTMAVK
ncbi:MAG TPA: glycosyl hydrolase [Bryobacteraceae bacterium]|nr:glycosyl hydrolase [Bryobacteraceae bacterium]